MNLINADLEAKKYIDATLEVSGTDYGIYLKGKKQPFKLIDGYTQVAFKISLDKGFTAETPLDEFGYRYINGVVSPGKSKAPDQHSGCYELVATMENDALGFDGALNRTGFPVPQVYRAANPASTYNMYVIEYNNVHESASLDRKLASPMVLVIAVAASTTTGSPDELIGDILDPYMASTPGNFAPQGK